jgi:hypothetical protein
MWMLLLVLIASLPSSFGLLSAKHGTGVFHTSLVPNVRFSTEQNITLTVNGTGQVPISGFCLGDFGGNNVNDIVLTLGYNNVVLVLLNAGAANMLSFSPGSTLATGSNPFSIIAGKFTTTKKLDLLLVNSLSATLGVFQGYGNGTFQRQKTLPTGPLPDPLVYRIVATTDFNNDMVMDIVAVGTNVLEVFVSNGEDVISFAPPLTLDGTGFISGPVSSVACGDINGDGLNDIIATNLYGVYVYLNTAQGLTVSFSSSYSFWAFFNNNTIDITGLLIVDANRDGRPDILVYGSISSGGSICSVGPSSVGGCAMILLNEGPSIFHKVRFASPRIGFCGVPPSGNYVGGILDMATADFNNAGDPDAVVTLRTCVSTNYFLSSTVVQVFYGDGNGLFPTMTTVWSPKDTLDVGGVAAGDVNNDGLSDVIISHSGASSVGVFLNSKSVLL